MNKPKQIHLEVRVINAESPEEAQEWLAMTLAGNPWDVPLEYDLVKVLKADV
jgi:hypothetical protein